jgi:hypothetical protein
MLVRIVFTSAQALAALKYIETAVDDAVKVGDLVAARALGRLRGKLTEGHSGTVDGTQRTLRTARRVSE